ncbi:META domain-containing protein [Methylicorpusculum oleiharenae]|uniref:META domain-containing protein n=1 Tax=Methylicorpusculum oleiharenae TaxID=1338687 RepID=UPI0013591A3F
MPQKNKISGRTSCNQYSGTVEIDEKGEFRVQNNGTIASTKMRCPSGGIVVRRPLSGGVENGRKDRDG